ncbi:type II toxin-antitoxin system Phd/YefM family antitoxin [Piscirickettsia salmonis]|uniref:type II toxin-antitoxin system Phd/YefM family antitoxin n=1 Tax=Piscirickettsia salmonis TaxID=1238 RepID=UPI00064CB2B3|nr:type II toxin-antitoxin system Phd/YefM family antitoxin [Piscirickettsia salmonis]KLV36868.1 hypothetical protein AB894_00875 [Piscirickettsia salmonis]
MKIISATNAKKYFGNASTQALQEPVIIEKHNRPELVLMSYETFISLKRNSVSSIVDTCQHLKIGDKYVK